MPNRFKCLNSLKQVIAIHSPGSDQTIAQSAGKAAHVLRLNKGELQLSKRFSARQFNGECTDEETMLAKTETDLSKK